jgi:hypothetical protein
MKRYTDTDRARYVRQHLNYEFRVTGFTMRDFLLGKRAQIDRELAKLADAGKESNHAS